MKHTEGTFRSAGTDIDIYWQAWNPDGKPKAIVALAHGIGEHSSRYAHVAKAFTDAGYSFQAFDHQGHGKSAGKRGFVADYDYLLDDYGVFIGNAQNANPGLKTFIYGHSMGGQIALMYALHRPAGLAGVIATGPHISLSFTPPGWKVWLGNFLGERMPGITLPTGLEMAALSRDEAVIKAYVDDPLTHENLSAGLGKGLLDTEAYLQSHAADLTLPALFMHGGADRITNPVGTRAFYEAASSEDKTHIEYEGLYHEIHNEPEQDKVFADMIGWLDARV